MTIWLCTECHREWVDPDDPPTEHDCYPEADSADVVKLVPDGGPSVSGMAVEEGVLNRGEAILIRKSAREIAPLPRGRFHSSTAAREDPSVEVPYADLPHGLKRSWRRTILRQVERRKVNQSTVYIWEVPERVHDYVEDYLEQLETAIPGCPHTGVRNVPRGGYTCCDDDCDNEVPREEVREE
jgi:hypothetical protein